MKILNKWTVPSIYLGSCVIEDTLCSKEIETWIAIAKKEFNRKIKLLLGPFNKVLRKENGKMLCL